MNAQPVPEFAQRILAAAGMHPRPQASAGPAAELQKLGIAYREKSGELLLDTCPHCGAVQHLYMSTSDGGPYMCHKCGAKGNLHTLQRPVSGGTLPATVQQAARPEKKPGRIVATYDYTDGSGALLYQVVRFDPKDFRQRRPDGKGGWVWSIKDVPPVPYNLPEILKADTVYIGEGEKDVETMRALGLVATCNSGGAEHWRPEFSQYLKGKHCIILPDNDPRGREHAADVAAKLAGAAVSIKIVTLPDLPEKGDVSDWITAGGTVSELVQLCDETPETEPAEQLRPSAGLLELREKPEQQAGNPQRQTVFDVNDILSGDFPAPAFLIPGVIPEGTGLLAGAPKMGKSFMALNIASAIATGGSFFGRQAAQGNVLCYCLEDNPGRLKHRLGRMMPRAPRQGVFTVKTAVELLPEFIKALAADLKHTHARFVLIDTLAAIRKPAGAHADIYQADYGTIAKIRETCGDAGASLMIVHHLRKSGDDNQFNRISGTTGLTGAGDYNLVLDKTTKSGPVMYGSIRDGEDYELSVNFNADRFTWECAGDAATVRTNETQQRILDALRDATEPLTPAQIVELTGIKSELVRKNLERLAADEGAAVQRLRRGHYTLSQASHVTIYDRSIDYEHSAGCDVVTDVTGLEPDIWEVDGDAD